MWVVNAMLISLLIQEVKHVLDGQGQGRAAVRGAEDGLKEVVHELLQRALGRWHGLTRGSPGELSGWLHSLPLVGRGGQAELGQLGWNGGSTCIEAPPPPSSLQRLYISAARGEYTHR